MKKAIMAIMIAACVALCAAVWPQSKVVKETYVPSPTPAVCATEAAVEKTKTTPPAEKEKEAASQTEVPQGLPHNTEPAAFEIPAAPEAQSTAESELTSKAAPKSVPEPPPRTTRSSNGCHAADGRYGLCGGLRLDRKPRPQPCRIRRGYV